MIRSILCALAGLLVATAHAETVALTAADGVKVHGDVWRAPGAKAPIIVAFHQAGSSAAEYAPIAPRLVKAGFTVLAIDQRSGDGAFGGTNRTAAPLGWRELSYDRRCPISKRRSPGPRPRRTALRSSSGARAIRLRSSSCSPPRIPATSPRSSPFRRPSTSPARTRSALPRARSRCRSTSTSPRARTRSRARRRS